MSNEPYIIEKIPNITKKMMTNIIRKIRCILHIRIRDESTRTVIGTDRDLYIGSVVLLDEINLSLDDELISEIV